MSNQLSLFIKQKSRAEQIYAAFEEFHRNNPEIWRHFKFYADQARARGRKCFSSNAIFERIRWFVDIETNGAGELKLNNNFRAYYARMYHVAVPKAAGFFRNRPIPGDGADLGIKLKALI
jgi:hypothetical protein